MFSTDANLPSPRRRFPFDTSGGASPQPLPDCHLSRTAIPDPPISDSLGDFHSGLFRFLSSFANSLSREYRPPAQGHGPRTLSFPFPDLLTQGRLHCTQRSRRKSRVAPQCRFKPVPYNGRLDHKGSTPLHEIRSPQRAGRSFHAIETRPTAAGKVASPQHPPQTGRKKQTPEAS